VTRFRVVSVSGWNINSQAAPGNGHKTPATIWYVLDSANCHRIEREFRRQGNRGWRITDPEASARAYAAELEQRYP
jgi:hypothetical protein